MGYVAAFSKHDSPPLAFILTKESLEVMVFPFVTQSEGNPLLIAAVTSMDLWKQEETGTQSLLDRNVLINALVLCKVASQLKDTLDDVQSHEMMRFIQDKIKKSEHDLVMDDLRERLRTTEESRLELERKIYKYVEPERQKLFGL